MVIQQRTLPPRASRFAPPDPNPDPPPLVFSLAFKDHTVSQALPYWVADGTLHYVSTQGKQFDVPLARLDRALSLKLNRDRGVEFGVPSGS